MKKKMFFKMGVALLLSLAVLVGLAGCGAKPSAPTDGGENTTYDKNTENPIEDAAAATNNLPEQDPDETNVDNGHDLTSQVGGPPYVYEVGGVNFECDINIYDYIYEKNGFQWVDIPKMAEDNGYEVLSSYAQPDNWGGWLTYNCPDGGEISVRLAKGTSNVTNDYKFIERILVQYRADPSENPLLDYIVTNEDRAACEYRLVKLTNFAVSLSQIKIIAYAISTAKDEGEHLITDPFPGMDTNNMGYLLH